MAIPISVGELLLARRVESTRIEYKANWNPEKVLHSICAFANDIDNTGGGYIVLGVEEENGRPVLPPCGLQKDSVDTINKQLVELCKMLDPAFLPIVEPTVYVDAELIVVWVPGGKQRPYKAPVVVAKDARSEKAYYIRKMACTLRANAQEEKELFELVEGRNTGIPTMIRAMRENGSPDPIFLTDEDRSYFTVVLPVYQNVPINVPINVLATGQRIEQAIIANPGINRKKLATLCGLSEKTIGRQIKLLAPRIVYRGSLKTGGYYAE